MIMIVIAMPSLALLPHLAQLLSARFSLPASFSVPPDGFVQVVLGLVYSPLTIVASLRRDDAAQHHKDR
jgi:hypothetical protein